MVRISKLTDYAMVIMAFMATAPQKLFQARDISQHTHLSLPTVSKLLKALARQKFLNSVRGTHGGYRLAMPAEEITVADLIQALEGPIALTECNLGHQQCETETNCALRSPWLQINQVITNALTEIRLSDLVNFNSSSSSISMPLKRVNNRKLRSSNPSEDIYDLQIRH